MRIKCWGSRGSIPVSGKEYNKYGGDTTCIEIRTRSNDIIIVDAGTGIRRLGKQLMAENRFEYHLVFTHAHWDHILGFPFFKPLYRSQARLNIYRCPFSNDYMEKMISKVIAPPNFPLRYADISAAVVYEKGCPGSFEIGSVTVVPIELSHPNGGMGYKFIEDGRTFVFLTDNELGFVHADGHEAKVYETFCQGADLLFHDAEYTTEEYQTFREFGHSDCSEVVHLSLSAAVKRLGLFHLNQDRTDDQMDRMVADCQDIISQKGSPMDCFAVGTDMVFHL